MTVKRSRINRSSSSCVTTVFPTPVPRPPQKTAPVAAVECRNLAATAENVRQKPGIFTVSSPEQESVDRRGEDFLRKMGGFLEKCYYCSNKFKDEADIFMYRDLRAFCSEECRQKQIDIDEDLKMLCVNPRAKRVNNNTNQFFPKQGKRNGGF